MSTTSLNPNSANAPTDFQTLLARAQAAVNIGDNAALIELGRALGFAAPASGIGPYLLGLAQSNLGNWDQAYPALQHALRLEPQHPDFLFQRSFVEMNRGQLDHAMQGFLHVLRLNPNNDTAHVNIGAIHARRGNRADAMEWFRRAANMNAKNFSAWNSLAEMALAEGNFTEALRCAESAEAIDPSHASLVYLKGTALELTGQLDAAFTHFERAHALNPAAISSLVKLTKLCAQRGQFAAAQSWADRAHAIAPDDANVIVAGAIAYQRPLPEMPPEIIANIFNTWASAYDKHLSEGLQSRAPELTMQVAEEWLAHRGHGEKSLSILDLGCGTGLFGVLAARYAKTMIGVDLAQGMLDVAAKRGIYQALHCAELGQYLCVAEANNVDLIAAADVFVYLGELQPLFAEAARVLKADGAMVFTVEIAPEKVGADYVLEPSGRYQHKLDYIQRCATQAGFMVDTAQQLVLRHEAGKPVMGAVVRLVSR